MANLQQSVSHAQLSNQKIDDLNRQQMAQLTRNDAKLNQIKSQKQLLKKEQPFYEYVQEHRNTQASYKLLGFQQQEKFNAYNQSIDGNMNDLKKFLHPHNPKQVSPGHKDKLLIDRKYQRGRGLPQLKKNDQLPSVFKESCTEAKKYNMNVSPHVDKIKVMHKINKERDSSLKSQLQNEIDQFEMYRSIDHSQIYQTTNQIKKRMNHLLPSLNTTQSYKQIRQKVQWDLHLPQYDREVKNYNQTQMSEHLQKMVDLQNQSNFSAYRDNMEYSTKKYLDIKNWHDKIRRLKDHIEKPMLPHELQKDKVEQTAQLGLGRDDFYKIGGTYKNFMNKDTSKPDFAEVEKNVELVQERIDFQLHNHHQTELPIQNQSEYYKQDFKPNKNPEVTNNQSAFKNPDPQDPLHPAKVGYQYSKNNKQNKENKIKNNDQDTIILGTEDLIMVKQEDKDTKNLTQLPNYQSPLSKPVFRKDISLNKPNGIRSQSHLKTVIIDIENRPIDKFLKVAGGVGNIGSYRHSNKYNPLHDPKKEYDHFQSQKPSISLKNQNQSISKIVELQNFDSYFSNKIKKGMRNDSFLLRDKSEEMRKENQNSEQKQSLSPIPLVLRNQKLNHLQNAQQNNIQLMKPDKNEASGIHLNDQVMIKQIEQNKDFQSNLDIQKIFDLSKNETQSLPRLRSLKNLNQEKTLNDNLKLQSKFLESGKINEIIKERRNMLLKTNHTKTIEEYINLKHRGKSSYLQDQINNQVDKRSRNPSNSLNKYLNNDVASPSNQIRSNSLEPFDKIKSNILNSTSAGDLNNIQKYNGQITRDKLNKILYLRANHRNSSSDFQNQF